MSELGLYIERKSLIHSLDPRVKLLWFVMVLFSSIVAQFDGSVSLLIFISLLVAMALARLSLTRFLITFLYSSIFFIVAVLVWASYYQNVGTYLFTFPIAGIRITDVGILVGTGKFFLIVNPVISMTIFFSTVKPYDLVQTFSRLGLPYKAGFMLLLSLRMLALAVTEIRNIMDVQKARGIEVDTKNPVKRVSNMIPVFIPLIIRVMSLAWDLSVTLMVRGFGYSKKRSYAFPLRWDRRDTTASILIIAIYSSIAVYKLMGFSLYSTFVKPF
ncbi:MAG: energy-coupling factor transporter transmembrane component T [Desulfurococcales archaeon]|nr:energy-coupling factor transporter transmembrane component T [Desulfurococcales archaeon]